MTKLPIRIDVKVQPLSVNLKCPHCSRQHKKLAKDLRAGTSIKCGCGKSFLIANDEFRRAQKLLDDFARRAKSRVK